MVMPACNVVGIRGMFMIVSKTNNKASPMSSIQPPIYDAFLKNNTSVDLTRGVNGAKKV